VDVFEVLLLAYDEKITDLTESVSSGSCQTIDEYRDVTGQIKGLQVASREVRSLQQRALED